MSYIMTSSGQALGSHGKTAPGQCMTLAGIFQMKYLFGLSAKVSAFLYNIRSYTKPEIDDSFAIYLQRHLLFLRSHFNYVMGPGLLLNMALIRKGLRHGESLSMVKNPREHTIMLKC